MKPSAPVQLVLLTLTAAAAGLLPAAPAERPKIEDYPSSYEFLQALTTWNHQHPEGVVTRPVPETAHTPVIVVTDPTSELAPPPFEITGPENLDQAVEKAKNIEHPDYKEKIRYHRSTHLSFPLHSIDGADMSQASIANVLGQGVPADHLKDSLDQQINKNDKDMLEIRGASATTNTGTPTQTPFIGSGPRSNVNISVSGR